MKASTPNVNAIAMPANEPRNPRAQNILPSPRGLRVTLSIAVRLRIFFAGVWPFPPVVNAQTHHPIPRVTEIRTPSSRYEPNRNHGDAKSRRPSRSLSDASLTVGNRTISSQLPVRLGRSVPSTVESQTDPQWVYRTADCLAACASAQCHIPQWGPLRLSPH